MPVIINHKICDNASACGGISACPVGVFTFNENTRKIEIDNDKCISCGLCESACPIGAIGFAKTNEDLEELKRAIDEDPRNPEDLFVDRYGGDVINESVLIEYEQIDDIVKNSKGKILIELFNDDSIMCLLKSITYDEIIKYAKCKKYYRCNVGNNKISNFNTNELPSLLVCQKGKIVKTIVGYFEEEEKDKLFNLLN